MKDALWRMSAHEVVSLIRNGHLSPKEVVEASINRIEMVDEKINALPIHCFERALNIANSIDIKKEKENLKSLMGLPIAVKDYNDVGGVLTTFGSKIFTNNTPKFSDETVSKLERNGANPIAKSNVPEWAGGHTFNPVFGVTRNPFDNTKTVGGSSGGSAAALASGQVWLATGNDLGGSLRTPAAFNNVVGLRPSPGVVPRGTRLQPFDTLWVEGPMARSVKDVSLMLDAGSGYSSKDPLSFEQDTKCFVDKLNDYKLPARISYSDNLGIVPMSKEITVVTNKAIRKLNHIGIEVSDKVPNFSNVLSGFRTLRGVLLATMLDDLIDKHRNEILKDIIENAEVGHNVSNHEIIEAEKTRKSLLHEMQLFFEVYDFLICPSTSVTPFNIEKPFVTEIDGHKCKTYIDWFAITFALTMTGCPVVSLPCGFNKNGLPVGIQILGQPRQEAKLLSFCSQLEELFNVSKYVPLEI